MATKFPHFPHIARSTQEKETQLLIIFHNTKTLEMPTTLQLEKLQSAKCKILLVQ